MCMSPFELLMQALQDQEQAHTDYGQAVQDLNDALTEQTDANQAVVDRTSGVSSAIDNVNGKIRATTDAFNAYIAAEQIQSGSGKATAKLVPPKSPVTSPN